MALRLSDARVPAIIRNAGKGKTKFFCMGCLKEREGWEYLVGFNPMHKESQCGACWAAPRVPPMKPLGLRVVLG
jgi:hypothetical protein